MFMPRHWPRAYLLIRGAMWDGGWLQPHDNLGQQLAAHHIAVPTLTSQTKGDISLYYSSHV